jgi:hypothetical protein
VFTNAGSPSFKVTNDLALIIAETPWSNAVVAGTTIYFTNSALPAVPLVDVALGTYQVVWSASNQGSCVASIIDRAVITGGTNIFTVVDDDELPPVFSGFALGGGSATIDVAVANAGFAVTGLVQDVDSGVAFASRPVYFQLLDSAGLVLASNSFSGYSDGAGLASAVAVTNWFSGLSLACGNTYTVRVFAADADGDRLGDALAATGSVLTITTTGSDGDAPTASNLRITNGVAATVTLTDAQVSTGGWSMALTLTHSSGQLVTNGAGQPTFLMQNPSGTHVFASSPLTWDSILKSGVNYFATNPAMPAAEFAAIMTGVYELVWSAQSDGLCFGATNGSGFISPGTNRFQVIDDDFTAPTLAGLNIGGGTGSGCDSANACPDPTRTNLVAGDIAIFAINTLTKGSGPTATNNDAFAFVALVDIPTGTRIKFTDNGWKSSTASFRNNEGTLTWAATSCIPAGTVIRWIATNTPTFNNGTLVATAGSFSPNIQGEQILAYQGPDSSPNFIYAVNDRLTGVWDVDAVDSHSSAIPPGLIDGYTAVAVGEFDNIILNTNNLAITGGRDDVLLYIGGQENWIGDDDVVFDLLQFNFSFPDLCTTAGTITDHDIRYGGWTITGLVQDVNSGVAVSNGVGLRYVITSTNGVVVSNYFATTFAQGSVALNALSNGVVPSTEYALITLGTYTAEVHAADADNDRPNDAAAVRVDVPFLVVDDDLDPPQMGNFFINGTTILTNPAELASVVISGQVRDITSGIGFTSAPPTFVVYSNNGGVALSGIFANAPATEGAALDWEPIWTSPIDLTGIADCGTYTVRVTIADADDDRIDDRRSVTQSFLIAVADGSGSDPLATNVLVNTLPPSSAVITDGELASGGWSLAARLFHPSGLQIDPPYTPEFIVRSPSDSNVVVQAWTSLVTVGSSLFVTNNSVAAVPYSNVETGLHQLFWSARSGGACFGEAVESPIIAGDTNIFLVVDDDATAPALMTNIQVNATSWTNNPAFTITWYTNHITDASGFSIRTATNEPLSTADGSNLVAAQTVIMTNLIEGVTTNWFFVVDGDNDRPDDALMSETTNLVFYLDMTAPTQVTGVAVALGPDDTSEVELDWNPLGDAGNPALSPWHTYRIYYTEGTSAPTLSDPFISVDNGPASLGTNVTGSAIVSNFVFDTTYAIALAGVDRAGNIGPISDFQTITMGAFSVTQGTVLVSTEAESALYWTAAPDKAYDILYTDALNFDDSLSNQWKLLSTVTNNWLVDTGSLTRVPPIDLINTMRFYRASRDGRWQTNVSPRLGTREVYAAKTTVLHPGENWMSFASEPDTNRLIDVFKPGMLPAGLTFNTAAKISWFGNFDGTNNIQGVATAEVWMASSGNWIWNIGGSGFANDMKIPENQGFLVRLPSSATSRSLLLVGRVPTQEVVQALSGGTTAEPRYHVLSYSKPTRVAVSNLGFRGSGFVGNNNGNNADEIRILQPGGSGSLTSPKARLRLRSDGTTWQYYSVNQDAFPGGAPPANAYIVEPDEAIIVIRRNGNTMYWTNNIFYTPPNKNMVP